MNYSILKNSILALGLFPLLFISSCKNVDDHAPCGRPDCSLIQMIETENGVQKHIISHTYTIVGGKKLIEETYWDILAVPSGRSLQVNNLYDNQARLTESTTTNTFNNGFISGNKVIYIYDVTHPERVTESENYDLVNNMTGYYLYSYSGTLDKAIRRDSYNTQNQIIGYTEFTYDSNENLIEESNYYGTTLNSKVTYSGYISSGEWQVKLYENFNPSNSSINTLETIRTFQNCTIENTLIKEDGILILNHVNTIVNDLIVSRITFDGSGNQLREGTYAYDCN